MIHVVGLSGGKDSTAMALRLAEVEPRDYVYICSPTGNEPSEMADHWRSLECLLRASLVRLTAGTLEGLIEEQHALPSHRMRWCTRRLKIEPTIEYLKANAPARRHGTYTRDLELAAAALDRVRADSAGYVGMRSTHERLRSAGVVVTLEAVIAWSEPERREADVWARLVLELRKRELDADVDPPEHVAKELVTRRDSQGDVPASVATH